MTDVDNTLVVSDVFAQRHKRLLWCLMHDVGTAFMKALLRTRGWKVDVVPEPVDGFMSHEVEVYSRDGINRAHFDHSCERYVDCYGNKYPHFNYPWRSVAY